MTGVQTVLFRSHYMKIVLISPINSMAQIALNYSNHIHEQNNPWIRELEQLDTHSHDEIENLYCSLRDLMKDVTKYLTLTNEKADIISKMQSNMIEALAEMVENRDENTGLHIERTAEYAYIIGKALSANPKYRSVITNDYLYTLKKAAPLHDIGKIKIPDAILNKPGKLTTDEMAVMRTHTTEGKSILLSALKGIEGENYLKEAINVATFHHERWDGNGYPMGLSKDSIPLSARIMSLADVFDALMSKRSYKEPFSFEDSCNIIKSSSRTQFDPDVVNAFLSVLDEIHSVSIKLSKRD